MTYTEALIESVKGNKVISCIGAVYSPDYLNIKQLGREVFVSDAVTTEKERKGNWKLFISEKGD